MSPSISSPSRSILQTGARWARVLAISAALAVPALGTLGCMGAVNSVTGLDISMEIGENAIHPADFPTGEPATGEKVMSMGMTATGDSLNMPEGVDVDIDPEQPYRMDLVTYESVGDGVALMEKAGQEVDAAGFRRVAEDKGSGAITWEKNGTLFLIAVPPDDPATIVYLRLVPKPAGELE